MSEIELIPTWYKGTTFRSRIEARWAVLFDELSVKWTYEPRRFELGETIYIPDFWLPELVVWVEIKGEYPDEVALRKAQLLSVTDEHRVFLFFGRFISSSFSCGYCGVYHYIMIPTGIGILVFWPGLTVPQRVSVPISEFVSRELGCWPVDGDPHAGLDRVLPAFLLAQTYQFEEARADRFRSISEVLESLDLSTPGPT